MTDTARFQIRRSWVFLSRFGGIAALLVGLCCLALPWLDPEVSLPVSLGIGALFLGLSIPLLRTGWRPGSYTIELSGEGIMTSTGSGWTPWSQIGELVERQVLQRVDLLDRSGARVVSLEYQTERFPEALRRVVERAQLAAPEQDSFRRSLGLPQWFVLCGMLVAAGFLFWTGVTGKDPDGLWLAPVLLGSFAVMAFASVLSVSLAPEGLAIRRGLRVLRLSWSDVAGAEFALQPVGRGMLLLDVFLVLRSGERKRIRPLGVNPFHLERRIAAWLARSAPAAARSMRTA